MPIPDALGGGPKEVTGTDSNLDDLDVERGQGGYLVGSLSVGNPTNSFQDVIVTVDLFDGDQNRGELLGSVTVKPGTTPSVDLTSVGSHTARSDAYFDLARSSD